uniref:Uncharacterized protein n=1 Tax=Ciona intestinalis TaxID=7719 RepID=H2XYX7_CIOIN
MNLMTSSALVVCAFVCMMSQLVGGATLTSSEILKDLSSASSGEHVTQKRYAESAFTSMAAKQMDHAAFQQLLRLFGKRAIKRSGGMPETMNANPQPTEGGMNDNYVVILAREDFLQKVLNNEAQNDLS